ncbi:MAG: hypothetical protein U1E10_16560, partial [Bdellovibrionales bacterium]|nr:hypothetical protein [Bdellovibrionales bacterium]
MNKLWMGFVAVVFGISFASAHEALLVTHSKEKQFQMGLEKGRISVFGKTYKAAEHCNEDTNLNPGELRVYTVKDNANVVVTWCPGSLDGASNWITIYQRGKKPIT